MGRVNSQNNELSYHVRPTDVASIGSKDDANTTMTRAEGTPDQTSRYGYLHEFHNGVLQTICAAHADFVLIDLETSAPDWKRCVKVWSCNSKPNFWCAWSFANAVRACTSWILRLPRGRENWRASQSPRLSYLEEFILLGLQDQNCVKWAVEQGRTMSHKMERQTIFHNCSSTPTSSFTFSTDCSEYPTRKSISKKPISKTLNSRHNEWDYMTGTLRISCFILTRRSRKLGGLETRNAWPRKTWLAPTQLPLLW